MQDESILVPIVALAIPIVAIAGGVVKQVHANRLKADTRMALIARGVPLGDIEAFLGEQPEAGERPVKDPMRSLGNARRTALVLIPLGISLTIFFLVFGVVILEKVDQSSGWGLIACSAAGLIPLAIGIGFLVDYHMQKREMSRFGLDVGADQL
jgi:hypothetical protein